MDYLKKLDDYKLYICRYNGIEVQDTTFQKLLNALLKLQLTDLSSRERTTKRALGYKSKIPIYVNQSMLLMCIRSYRLESSFYINYFAIMSHQVLKDHVIIDFIGGHSMKIPEKRAFVSQLSKCRRILEFLNHEKMLS